MARRLSESKSWCAVDALKCAVQRCPPYSSPLKVRRINDPVWLNWGNVMHLNSMKTWINAGATRCRRGGDMTSGVVQRFVLGGVVGQLVELTGWTDCVSDVWLACWQTGVDWPGLLARCGWLVCDCCWDVRRCPGRDCSRRWVDWTRIPSELWLNEVEWSVGSTDQFYTDPTDCAICYDTFLIMA